MREIGPKDADYECLFLAKHPKSRYRYNRKSTYNMMAVGKIVIYNGLGYTIRCKSIGAGVYEVWAEER